MLPARRALIAYDPPAQGQAVRARDPHAALDATRRFLDACSAPVAPPTAVTLTIAERHPLARPDYAPEPLLADAIARFGVGGRRAAGRQADGTPLGVAHVWVLPPERVDDVASLLSARPHASRDPISPARASIAWRVLLTDVASGAVLPGQGPAHDIGGVAAASRITLWLAGRSRATFALRFPFERPDEAFLACVAGMQPYVPLRIAWSRFQLVTCDASGRRFTTRKLPARLFDGM